jgi:prepilin-type N-terminal cleavage/methylation domain-containing protein
LRKHQTKTTRPVNTMVSINQQSANSNQQSQRRRRGLSLVEMLIALAISAMLLTATMVAIDASFHAYAQAAEMASTQTSTRLVTHRLLTFIRTGTAHGPLQPGGSVSLDGDILTSPYLELIDPNNNLLRVEYHPDTQDLWLTITPLPAGASQSQPLLSGVTAATFFCKRRTDDQGVLVLERATMDLTVEPAPDGSLSLEAAGHMEPLRIIASTMPRKLE